jgi:hypothetical protein
MIHPELDIMNHTLGWFPWFIGEQQMAVLRLLGHEIAIRFAGSLCLVEAELLLE